jgi:hypothetical protein
MTMMAVAVVVLAAVGILIPFGAAYPVPIGCVSDASEEPGTSIKLPQKRRQHRRLPQGA